MDLIIAVILGIALGITEFIPVSSLGHSIVLESVFNFPRTVTVADVKNARDALAVFIQVGAVLAVIVYYGRDLLAQARRLPTHPETRRFWLNILVAFIPIGVLGFLFNKQIKQIFFSPIIVGISLIVGGIVFLLIEQRKPKVVTHDLEQITLRQALTVGIAQIAALIPGISRSGSSIIGGLFAGMDRKVVTSFSFYLFIPTLGAAAGYELFRAFRDKHIDSALLPYFAIATVVAFLTSLGVIRWLLGYVSTHSFRVFGFYRIIIGVVVIVLVLAGAAS